MGQYHILVNLDKKEYVEPNGLKHMNHLHDSRSLPHVQYLLNIAQGNILEVGEMSMVMISLVHGVKIDVQ